LTVIFNEIYYTRKSFRSDELHLMSTIGRITALVVSATLAAACAPLPEPAAVSSRDAVLNATNQWGAPGSETAWPTSAAWAAFGDPQLTALVERVVKANPSLAAAQAHARAAAAAVEGERSALSPQFGLRVNPAREQISANGMFPPPFGGQTFSLLEIATSLTYHLDLSGAMHAVIAARQSEADAARWDAVRASQALAAATARAYFELAAAIADRNLLTSEQTDYRRLSAMDAARFHEGLELGAVAHQSAATATAFGEMLTAADERIGRARAVLAVLAGEGPDAMANLTPPTLAVHEALPLPADLRIGLLAHRPDVQATRDLVRSASLERTAAHRAYLPDIDFGSMLGVQARSGNTLFHTASREWTADPALSLPIFDGGRRGAVVHAQEAQYDAAVADYERTVVAAVNDVTLALLARRSNTEALTTATAALRDDEAALESVERRFHAGISPESELVGARLRLTERHRDINRLIARAHTIDADLLEALGGETREEKHP
jgi:NodT family efflux transporter outer membrane factor (OMF) lipoprotein